MKDNPTIPRGEASLLSGASGAGKTTLLLQAIEAWARGETFLPQLTWNATSVAYIVADRKLSAFQRKLERFKIPPEKFQCYAIIDDLAVSEGSFNVPRLLFENSLKAFKRPFDLLIVDPMGPFLKGKIIDYTDILQNAFYFNRKASQLDITIILVHHNAKTRSDQIIPKKHERAAGSVALGGYLATKMTMDTIDENSNQGYSTIINFISPDDKQVDVYLSWTEGGRLVYVPVGKPLPNQISKLSIPRIKVI